jgi:2-phosphosulfolactate phosphatase
VNSAHRQPAFRIRFDWGPTGAVAIADGADLAVVVDVLSFTTTLCVAVERGITVLPFPWNDARASDYAAARSAVLGVGRPSLSPAAMASSTGVDRVVLPSPNGSSISFGLADHGAHVVGACLRNRSAVARWLAPAITNGSTVGVVAAGERWPDGSMRPAIEDLWGAGAVLAALADLGATLLSPEARVAEQAFRGVEHDVAAALRGCASGRELIEAGFAEDVDVAAELDVAAVVPMLNDGEFRSVTN